MVATTFTGATLHAKFGALGYSRAACDDLAPQLMAIRRLAAERDAIILAHHYQRPEILEIADITGDSLELARAAQRVTQQRIVFAGVEFMAETAKVLNPTKTVLLPNRAAGCSLADSADVADVAERIAELRKLHPNLGVVAYVNTSVSVKALADICCTSSNAAAVVRSLAADPILFLPDRNLAAYVQGEVPEKTIIAWQGNCYVHQQVTPEQVRKYRDTVPGIVILVHPECRKDVQALADGVGSTSAMLKIARERPERQFLIVTECGVSDRLIMELPEKQFLKACNLCAFMKANTVLDLRHALEQDKYAIEVEPAVAVAARRAIERMLAITPPASHAIAA